MLAGLQSVVHASPAVALSLVTLLWQGDLGEQKVCLPTSGLVLVLESTKVAARAIEDGTSQFSHTLVERHGPLDVPCRIQGIEVLGRRPVVLPGLRPPVIDRAGASGESTAAGLVCLAGQKELHCLSLPTGRVLWRSVKEDGCVLSLHAVGDVDADGTDDVVCCGCNVAECFSGRTGAVFWRFDLSGRSLWAGSCGDLDRDRLGEVLLQAGAELRVLSPTRGGAVRTLFQPTGFLPRATLPVQEGVLIGFGGSSVWLWSARGEGKKVWESKTKLFGIHAFGDRRLIATTDGLWVSESGGDWKHTFRKSLRASVPSGESLLAVDDAGRLLSFRPENASEMILAEVGDGVVELRVNETGTHVCIVTGSTYRVYRWDAEAEPR